MIPAVGVMLPEPHRSAIAFMVAVGGFLTEMTCGELVVLPQEFVVVSLTEYSPALLNTNDGFAELAVLPLANANPDTVPQLPLA